jgi:hypothetical protein
LGHSKDANRTAEQHITYDSATPLTMILLLG